MKPVWPPGDSSTKFTSRTAPYQNSGKKDFLCYKQTTVIHNVCNYLYIQPCVFLVKQWLGFRTLSFKMMKSLIQLPSKHLLQIVWTVWCLALCQDTRLTQGTCFLRKIPSASWLMVTPAVLWKTGLKQLVSRSYLSYYDMASGCLAILLHLTDALGDDW